ncbi:PKD domain-containing protein [Undibacterium sp. Dicai25W]|uniref:PKD domain-containing protein n=1 Tax=Undibacterium sp. Dicai25W TaxID=3413034 RepID=UPI003BF1FDCC
MSKNVFLKRGKILPTMMACAVLVTACGGGGGGDSTATSATPTLPQISAPSINLAGTQTVYVSSVVMLTALAGSTSGNNTTYSWDFGDGSPLGSGSSVTHTYSKTGTFVVTVTASSAGYQSTSVTKSITVNANVAPSAPTITIGSGTGGATAFANNAQTFSASSKDPASLTLSYLWDFGDGTPTVPGQNVSHTYANTGNYNIKVAVSNTANLSANSSVSVSVLTAVPAAPVIQANPVTAVVNQTVNFSSSASDPMGLPLTYQWNFGDGSTGTGATPTHAYSATGSYNVTLKIADSAGNSSSSAPFTETVVTATNGALVVDCTGTNCGANSPTAYSGSGVGIWRYNNTGSTTANINIAISGVSAGKTATLVFSNGTVNSASAPSIGVSSAPVFANKSQDKILSPEDLAYTTFDPHHTDLIERNRQVLKSLQAFKPSKVFANPKVQAPTPTPTVGTVKSWTDLFPSTPIAYSTAVANVCSVTGGRNVVFWLDPNATSSGTVTTNDITTMASTVCGTAGFSRLSSLLGDVWGPVPTQYSSQLIQDTTGQPQDINIVILNVPSNTGWAGYFYGLNNQLTSVAPSSNQALVFFINASQIQNNRNYALSTLLHEATHMTNFYQRAIVRGLSHETWLEESSAMMTEDIVVPAILNGYNTAEKARLPSYLGTGGGVNYIKWPALSGANYALGGSFDAFLSRRYGLSIYKQLITSCTDGVTTNDSYTCLDTLIKNNGGIGLADEFTRFGASVFSKMSGINAPTGYGFPFKVDGGYSMSAIDLSTISSGQAATIGSTFTSTTHYYQTDAITKSTYTRTGVLVPAGTNFSLIIK